MAFCENCGAKLAPGARFCEECGAPVADVSEAEATQEKSVRLSERPAFCENCGAKLAPDAHFCEECSVIVADEIEEDVADGYSNHTSRRASGLLDYAPRQLPLTPDLKFSSRLKQLYCNGEKVMTFLMAGSDIEEIAAFLNALVECK